MIKIINRLTGEVIMTFNKKLAPFFIVENKVSKIYKLYYKGRNKTMIAFSKLSVEVIESEEYIIYSNKKEASNEKNK